MWPSLLIVGVGRRHEFPLPLPLFLLWPFLLLGWLAFGLGWLLIREWRARPVLAGMFGVLTLAAHLRGLRVDVRPPRGAGVRICIV
jgi:hypothetical protein